jgi:hypothetical protein
MPLKIQIKTNQKGKVEVIDAETGDLLNNVKVMYITVNAFGKATAELTVKDVQVDINVEKEK